MLWLSESLYMYAFLEQDLFGGWEVNIAQGGRHNRLGRVYSVVVDSEAAGAAYLQALDKKRLRHGYQQMDGAVMHAPSPSSPRVAKQTVRRSVGVAILNDPQQSLWPVFDGPGLAGEGL